MASLHELLNQPELNEPLLVLGLGGWIDAGGGAQSAVEALEAHLSFETVATFDTDLLLDHRSNRPMMELDGGRHQGIVWPKIELKWARDINGKDILLLAGSEPDHLWQSFAADVVQLGIDLGVRLVLSLGAYPAPVPHTRPTELSATATTDELADAIGSIDAAIEVPAGIHGVIEWEFGEKNIPASGLWARVPHYASAMPYPAAARALLDGLAETGEVDVPDGVLLDEVQQIRHRLDELVEDSPEHQQLLAALEAEYDEIERLETDDGLGVDPEDLPSGDELAGQIQDFLRDRNDPTSGPS